MKVLRVNNVSKSIGKRTILSQIEMSMEEGEIVGLVGPNGAGKTSLMKLIGGFNFPSKDSGSIEICGHDVVKDRVKAMSHSAFLVEDPGLYPNLSGHRHLKMFCAGRGVPESAIDTVSDFLNFQSQLGDKVRTYSVGMKQRLALALCWVAKPKLLVLDEPLNGLDPDGIFLVRNKIEEAAAAGAAVLVSSHLLDELQKISSRVIFINHGKIIGSEDGKDFETLEQQYRRLFSET